MSIAKRLTMLVIALFCFLLPLSACNDGTGASVRYDISVPVSNLDPQYAYTEEAEMIVSNAFEGLFEQNGEGEAVPAAAQQMTFSDDGLTATITLRDGLLWSDGSAVTAGDYAFALRRLFTPEYPSAYAVDFSCLKNADSILRGFCSVSELGVDAPDEKTLVLTLEYPVDHLAYLLCSTAALPCKESFFYETRGRYGLERETLLYNGPFRVYYWEDEMVQLRPNPVYRDVESVLPRSVTFNVSDAEEQFERLESGKNDAAQLSYAEWNSLKDRELYSCEQFEDTVWVLIFNEQPEILNREFFASFDGRRALMQAIDHRAFAPDLGYDLVETTVLLPPTLSFYGESYRKRAGFTGADLFNARAAGEHFRTASMLYGNVHSITVLVPDEDTHAAAAAAIQRCWRDTLALNTNLIRLSEEELLERVHRGDYQAAIIPLRPDSQDPGGMLADFLSTSADNIAGYSSMQYDTLFKKAASAGDEAERLWYYRRAELLLYEDAVLVPLYFQTHYYVTAPGVEGIRISPFAGEIQFRNAIKR